MQPDGKTSYYAYGLQNVVEQREPIRLRVKGSIPPWLTGSLYRTGPGTTSVPLKNGGVYNVQYWFDSIGMHHKFEVKQGGEVWYRNHKSAEHLEETIAETGWNPTITFGQSDPCETIFHKFFTVFKQTVLGYDTMNRADSWNIAVTLTPNMPGVNVPASHSSSKSPAYLVAKSDDILLQVIDAETLQPIERAAYNTMDPRLANDVLSGAHSCTDPETHDFYNYTCSLGDATYKVLRIRGSGPDRGKLDVLAEIKDAPIVYLHSSCLTQKYYILCIWQADINYRGLSILLHRNFLAGLERTWNPTRSAIFYVIDREKGGIVAKYNAPAFFCFHPINSFDDGDDVVLDLSVYNDHSILFAFDIEKMRHPLNHPPAPTAAPRRFRLKKVSSGRMDADAEVSFSLPTVKGMELPTVHPRLYHKKYRYAYGVSVGGGKEAIFSDQLLKLDMDHPGISSSSITDGGRVWREEGCMPGEPIFVPDPNGTEEDDGVVLSIVLVGKLAKSMLVVLNAKDMTELGRAEMETVFPIGFHGVFVR